jgi:hypothetical protein
MKIIIILLIILSCQTKLLSSHSSIEGSWCLVEIGINNEVNYGRIDFNSNGIITLYSRADTIYSYKYQINKNDLLIIRHHNDDTLKSHIVSLNSNSLVLSSLIEKNTVQKYYRCNMK